MSSKFAKENENVFQLLGDDFVPQTPYRGSPWIPLGDPSQRRRAIEALEARSPQTDLPAGSGGSSGRGSGVPQKLKHIFVYCSKF